MLRRSPTPPSSRGLRSEVQRRVVEMTRSMTIARDLAAKLGDDAKAARARDEGRRQRRGRRARARADAERATMHAMLAELAALDAELKELERVSKAAAEAARSTASAAANASAARPATAPGKPVSGATLDDALSELKRRAAAAPSDRVPHRVRTALERQAARGDHRRGRDLAALKQRMASVPPKKKP